MHNTRQRQGAGDSASTTGHAREDSTAARELHAAWSWAADGLWYVGHRPLTHEQRRDLVATAEALRLRHHGAVDVATDDLLDLLRKRNVSTYYARPGLDRPAVRRWLQACWRPHGEAHPCWCDSRLP